MGLILFLFKQKYHLAVIIAQWISLLLPSAALGSNPKHNIYAFSICNWMALYNHVVPPIPFVYWFGLQHLRRHMCCRAIKTTIIGRDRCDRTLISLYCDVKRTKINRGPYWLKYHFVASTSNRMYHSQWDQQSSPSRGVKHTSSSPSVLTTSTSSSPSTHRTGRMPSRENTVKEVQIQNHTSHEILLLA